MGKKSRLAKLLSKGDGFTGNQTPAAKSLSGALGK
jgi:hypothetical protein